MVTSSSRPSTAGGRRTPLTAPPARAAADWRRAPLARSTTSRNWPVGRRVAEQQEPRRRRPSSASTSPPGGSAIVPGSAAATAGEPAVAAALDQQPDQRAVPPTMSDPPTTTNNLSALSRESGISATGGPVAGPIELCTPCGRRRAAARPVPGRPQLPQLSRSRLQALVREGHLRQGERVIAEPGHRVKPGERFVLDVPRARAGRARARGAAARGPVRGRAPDRAGQAGRPGRPPGAGPRRRHAGQRAAGALRRQPVRHRRRAAAGHRAPARPRGQRRDGGRQARPRPYRPRRPVQRPLDRPRLRGDRLGRARDRSRQRRPPARPPSDRPQAHGDRAQRRQAGGDPLAAARRPREPAPRGSSSSWRPGGPTRSGCTRPAWATRSSATASTAAARAAPAGAADAIGGLDRILLHARRLGFTHPITGEPLAFEAPPPPLFDRDS